MYKYFSKPSLDVNTPDWDYELLDEKRLGYKLNYFYNQPIYEQDSNTIVNLIFNKPVCYWVRI